VKSLTHKKFNRPSATHAELLSPSISALITNPRAEGLEYWTAALDASFGTTGDNEKFRVSRGFRAAKPWCRDILLVCFRMRFG
jgi:hypothetical protein